MFSRPRRGLAAVKEKQTQRANKEASWYYYSISLYSTWYLRCSDPLSKSQIAVMAPFSEPAWNDGGATDCSLRCRNTRVPLTKHTTRFEPHFRAARRANTTTMSSTQRYNLQHATPTPTAVMDAGRCLSWRNLALPIVRISPSAERACARRFRPPRTSVPPSSPATRSRRPTRRRCRQDARQCLPPDTGSPR